MFDYLEAHVLERLHGGSTFEILKEFQLLLKGRGWVPH